MQVERLSRGYTLIEVLVAFMIMAMALTVLMRIFSTGIRNVAVSADYARAVVIAESKLAATGIDNPFLAGVSGGVEDERFEWTRSVEPYVPSPDYSNSTSDVRAWHVVVTVEWPHGTNSRNIDLSTVKLSDASGYGL